MNKSKLKIISLVLLIIAVSVGVGWYLFGQEDESDKAIEDAKRDKYADYIATHTLDGVVALYSVEQGQKIDQVDLKEITNKKEKVTEVEQPKVEKPVQKDMFEGFEQVTMTINEGQHVWGIQSELTPHINTIKMLPKLKEINEGKSLHPVYPGEERVFLKAPSNEPVETSEEPVAEKVTETIENAEFIYYVDQKNQTVYGYSDFTNEVYRLTVENDKWKAEVLVELPTEQLSDWVYVDDDYVWLADKAHKHIQVFSVEDPKKVKEWDAKGEMTDWHINGEILHYTYGKHMASEKLGGASINDIVLGDTTIDLVYADEKFYVLNSFGKGLDNSVLFKVNPQDLYVDDLIELKSDQASILSHGEDGTVFVGKIEKIKQLDGEITEEPKVSSIDVTSTRLVEETMKWELLFSPSMKGWNKHLYAIEDDNVLRIYPSGKKNPVKEFEVETIEFSVLP